MIRNPSPLFLWWIVTISWITTLFVSYRLGILEMIYLADRSSISVLMLCLFVLVSFMIGYAVRKAVTHREYIEPAWMQYISHHFQTLGLTGTLIGFILMFGDSFIHFTPGDINSGVQIIKDIASGAATAMYTTLVGLIAYLFSTIQLRILSDAQED
jgi:phosphatidylglycerophosphate synthase